MTKREAIEILKKLKTLDDSMFAYSPYSQAYNDALDMAIEALKAQEQELRVLTLEEAQVVLHNETVVWVELKDMLIAAGVRMNGTDYFTMQNDDVLGIADFDDGDGAALYGKKVRCWTSRPTDEQREATPWTQG